MSMVTALSCPIGAFENSPAIYRRGRNDKLFLVPSGRLNKGDQASLQDAIGFFARFPGIEMPGYFQMSLQDKECLNRSIYDCFGLNLVAFGSVLNATKLRRK